MNRFVKAQVLLAILKLAPVGRSLDEFEQYAADGNADAIWRYIDNATRYRGDVGRSVQNAGKISFETLRPAIDAVYRIPESEGV